MCKKIIVILLLLPVLNGWAQSFEKKQVDINLGIGFGNTFAASGHYRSIPPLSMAIEYGVTDDISIGGYMAYTGASWRYSGRDWCNAGGGNWGYYDYVDVHKWSFFILGVRGAYHFGRFIKVDELDLYAGALLGNNFARFTYSTTDPCHGNRGSFYSSDYGGLIFGGFIGARYRFTEKVGVYSELGYGISFVSLGVNFKLN